MWRRKVDFELQWRCLLPLQSLVFYRCCHHHHHHHRQWECVFWSHLTVHHFSRSKNRCVSWIYEISSGIGNSWICGKHQCSFPTLLFLKIDVGIMCEPCNGKGWLLCDFCKGQKTNVKAENNRIYRRCPSCRAVSCLLIHLFKRLLNRVYLWDCSL